MIRYIKSAQASSNPIEFEINVNIALGYVGEEVAAATYKGFEIPDGEVIPGDKDAIFTDQIIADYEAFIESVEDLLTEYYDLELLYEGESSDYSHYYSFLAKDKNTGKLYFKFRLRLRVSNHHSHRSKESQRHKREETQTDAHKKLITDAGKKPKAYTKNIIVNNKEYETYEAAFIAIDRKVEKWIKIMKQ